MLKPDTLLAESDRLFAKRRPVLALWQELADNFYPERADFTSSRSFGQDFASHLSTSYPIGVRQELGNQIGSMLRPRSFMWFRMVTDNFDNLSSDARRWLESSTQFQYRAMYQRGTSFARATKQGDHDFATFGQAVISLEADYERNQLLYRCWHLRDVVWKEDYSGRIDTVHRRWKPAIRQLVQRFGEEKLDSRLRQKYVKTPDEEVECLHVVMPRRDYEKMFPNAEKISAPFVQMYLDRENQSVLDLTGSPDLIYIIPRWQTVSGSQYAFSPSAVAGLPDSRLLQSITLSLLEAGEKAVEPPLIVQDGAVRGDLALYARGATFVDPEYDERLGDVIRPIPLDFSGIGYGQQQAQIVQAALVEAFFLNKLRLPQMGVEMTAFETAQRVQEYIRQALPLFEPLEEEYNGALCERTFEVLLRNGAFGAYADVPEELQGREVQFQFESPLHQAAERQKPALLNQGVTAALSVSQLDPAAAGNMLNIPEALRDVYRGIGMPEDWIRSQQEMEERAQAQQQAMQQQQQLEQLRLAAETAEKAGRAQEAFSQSQMG